jgi:protein CrcB
VLGVIALGGALGATARYGVAQLVHVAPDTFPWATFWTNGTGSFALGLILALVLERFPPGRYLRPFLATGFLGAYTTYSTFVSQRLGHPRHLRRGGRRRCRPGRAVTSTGPGYGSGTWPVATKLSRPAISTAWSPRRS